jgi:dTDP-4-amino-4,6-dideoxygalactose transaminase
MSSEVIPLAIPVVGEAEARYLQECIDTNFVSSVGPFTTRFEAMVAAATGAASGVATSSGTTGLHAALLTLGVGRDDLVVMPSFTFIASANAIAHCGASPWLMDIDGRDWLLDLAQVEQELARHAYRHRDGRLMHRPSGRRIAALMPVYTLGTVTDIDAQRALAAQYALPVIADAAAALGATWRGRPLAEGADLSVISFNGNKVVTCGGGGTIVGNDADLMRLARHLTTTARTSSDYTFDQVGYNYRITNVQAAIGCAQMEKLDGFVAAKRAIRARYTEALAAVPGISLFPGSDNGGSACWFSGIVVDDPALPPPAELAARMRAQGVEARTFWKPAHLQAPFAHAPRAALPVTEALWSRILTLPCSTNLTEAQQERTVAALRAALQ